MLKEERPMFPNGQVKLVAPFTIRNLLKTFAVLKTFKRLKQHLQTNKKSNISIIREKLQQSKDLSISKALN